MGWRLIVYCVLALALTGSFLFITIENESLSSKENNSSIFNAKEIEIRSSSKNKEIFPPHMNDQVHKHDVATVKVAV